MSNSSFRISTAPRTFLTNHGISTMIRSGNPSCLSSKVHARQRFSISEKRQEGGLFFDWFYSMSYSFWALFTL